MLEAKYNQIILYIVIIIFSIGFLFYFYNQGVVGSLEIENMKISQDSGEIIEDDFNINLNLLKSEKFKRLKDIGLPALKFEIGKKNPFEPY